MDLRGRRRRSGVTTRLAAVAAVLVLGATACDNGATDEGAAGRGTAPGSPDSPAGPASVGDLSGQCLTLIVDMLQRIEPYVAGHDPTTMHSDDFDVDGLTAAMSVGEEQLQSTCASMNTPEAYQVMADLARRHAPGTVWYVEMMAVAEQARSGG